MAEAADCAWASEPLRTDYASVRIGETTYSIGEHAYVSATAGAAPYIARIVALYETPAAGRSLTGEWVYRARDALSFEAVAAAANTRHARHEREVFPSRDRFEAPVAWLRGKAVVARRADLQGDGSAFAALGPDYFFWSFFYDPAAGTFSDGDPTAPPASASSAAAPGSPAPRGVHGAHGNPPTERARQRQEDAQALGDAPRSAKRAASAGAGAPKAAADGGGGSGSSTTVIDGRVVITTPGMQRMALPEGWRVEWVPRAGAPGKSDKWFFSPEGKKLRTYAQINEFLVPFIDSTEGAGAQGEQKKLEEAHQNPAPAVAAAGAESAAPVPMDVAPAQ
eukprot:m51a1_g5745 hypothetical protein (337) ;mRNA; r:1169328-1170338